MIELACPESCQYLRDARESELERDRQWRLRARAAGEAFDHNIGRELLPVVIGIDEAIVTAQRESLRDLDDAEILAAVENAIKNLETESSGLIYEHRSGTPRIEEVSRRVRAKLEQINADGPGRRVTSSEMISALKFVRGALDAYIRRAQGEGSPTRAYLRHIALFFPWPEDANKRLIT
jgi:hypothetical protein